MTALCTPFAPGSTRGGLGTSWWGCIARASTCNWLSTMTGAGERPSTQQGWNTRPRARRAQRGSGHRGARSRAQRGMRCV